MLAITHDPLILTDNWLIQIRHCRMIAYVSYRASQVYKEKYYETKAY